jgi:hypothetical protein
LNPPRFISRLLSSPALASQEAATDGWTLFDTTETYPDLATPFTVRVPPGFAALPPPGQTSLDASSLLVTLREFHLKAGVPGRAATLTLGMVLAPAWAAEEGGQAALEHWDGVGNDMAMGHGAVFDGARQFTFRGKASADLFFSGLPAPGRPGGVRAFSAVRAVIAGEAHVLLGSVYGFPSAEAQARGYSSRENPFLRESFLPFADSILFKRLK